jgi:transcriptional regulator with XRE-family HTH domain
MTMAAAPRRDGDIEDGPAVATLSGALLDWRRRHGLSRLAAARPLGVAHTTVRQWETGDVRPQPLQLIRVAEVLGREVGELRSLTGPDRVRTCRTSGGPEASALCRARLAAGLTMTQLARKVGVTPSSVSRWENGVRHPGPHHVARLGRALGLDPRAVPGLLHPASGRRRTAVLLPGLGALRRSRGWSQRAFREAAGVGATTAGRWERGRTPVPQDRLPIIARLLGLGVADVVAIAAGPGAEPAPRSQLAALRWAVGLTQREVALHVGVSIRTVVAWESGGRRPPASSVRLLAGCLRVPASRVRAAVGVELPTIPHPATWRNDDLPDLLGRLRAAAGLSAAEVGRRLSVPRQRVRAWESGLTGLSPGVAQRLELLHDLPSGVLARIAGSPASRAD